MSLTVNRESVPSCFGKVDNPPHQEGWNAGVAACAGGPDATFTDEKTGSHVRERCTYFNECGTKANAKKFEMMRQNLIAPSALVKQQPPIVGPPNKVAEALLAQQQQQQLVQQQAQYQAMMQQQAVQMAQLQKAGVTVPQMMMPTGYQQMMPVNYQMPSYLTATETVEPGGFWKAMARTVFRSIGKSMGHSVAHMFDSIPFSAVRPPKE